MLWVGVAEDSVVCQGRMGSVKLVRKNSSGWNEVAEFKISHEGFCKGLIIKNDVSTLLACPSGQSGVIITRLSDTYIRPVVTLDPHRMELNQVDEKFKYGTVMAVTWAGQCKLLALYEGGVLQLWEWSTNRVLARLDVAI